MIVGGAPLHGYRGVAVQVGAPALPPHALHPGTIFQQCFGFHPCNRGQGLHGQPRCMVLARDERRLFDIGYRNHHYELLPFRCYNHALFHGCTSVLLRTWSSFWRAQVLGGACLHGYCSCSSGGRSSSSSSRPMCRYTLPSVPTWTHKI